MKKYLLAIIFVFTFLNPLNAQIFDSSYFQWTVYDFKSNALDERKCYMISYPIRSDSDHNSRQKPYVMITRFQDRRIEEVSIYSGFTYKGNSQILIMVDDQKFELTTNKDMAWAKSKIDDVRIIQAIIDGAKLQVRSDSDIGTFAIDEYSLKGIAKAYSRLKKVCD